LLHYRIESIKIENYFFVYFFHNLRGNCSPGTNSLRSLTSFAYTYLCDQAGLCKPHMLPQPGYENLRYRESSYRSLFLHGYRLNRAGSYVSGTSKKWNYHTHAWGYFL